MKETNKKKKAINFMQSLLTSPGKDDFNFFSIHMAVGAKFAFCNFLSFNLVNINKNFHVF